jgi:hypothetical protein
MTFIRIIVVLLIVAGVAGLLIGSFSYEQDSTAAKLGPLQLTLKEQKTVEIPRWLSLGAIGVGVVVLLLSARRP